MNNDNENYSALYKLKVQFVTPDAVIDVPTSDIISLAFINNYDTMTHPMIRLRIYSDLSIIQQLCYKPDEVFVNVICDGAIYRMSNNETSPVMVCGTTSPSFQMKGYFENKNISTSIMDQYKEGKKISDDLNENIKYPFEIFCYNETAIRNSKEVSQSIYKDMSLESIIRDIFSRIQNDEIVLDALDNTNKFNQVLIPNLNALEAMSFLERFYGLHKKGTQVFIDYDKSYIVSSASENMTNPIPIYVASIKNNSDMSGLMRVDDKTFRMTVLAPNVSVMSQSDIEKTINGSNITAINLNTNTIKSNELSLINSENDPIINTPVILHKYNNNFITDLTEARINERITRVDVSGVGFDIFKQKINSRYNLIFESPIRGFDINRSYRATYVAHVLSNMDNDLFIATTTMNLCCN